MITYAEDAPILYYAQSGDSLGVLAVRFGVEVQDITSRDPLPSDGFIPEGQLLLIPNRLDETTSPLKLIPDSEVVDSPSSVGFDVAEFVQEAGGYLASYQESVYNVGFMNGADIIERSPVSFPLIRACFLLCLNTKAAGCTEDLKQRNKKPILSVLLIRIALVSINNLRLQLASLKPVIMAGAKAQWSYWNSR